MVSNVCVWSLGLRFGVLYSGLDLGRIFTIGESMTVTYMQLRNLAYLQLGVAEASQAVHHRLQPFYSQNLQSVL